MNLLPSKKITLITDYKPVQVTSILKKKTGKLPRFIFDNPGTPYLGYVNNDNFRIKRNNYRGLFHQIKYPDLFATGKITLESRETRIHLTFKCGRKSNLYIWVMPAIAIILLIGKKLSLNTIKEEMIIVMFFISIIIYGLSVLNFYIEYSDTKSKLIELFKAEILEDTPTTIIKTKKA